MTIEAKVQEILDWKVSKPSKDIDWAEDVKKESLHVKYDYQLSDMEKSHSDKLLKVQKDLDKFTKWPEVVRYELTHQFEQMFEQQGNPKDIEGKTLQEWVDEEFASQQTYYTWKVNKLEQSIERIKKERELRAKGFLVTDKNDDKSIKDVKDLEKIPEEQVRHLLGTTYYIDPVNGTDTFLGTRIDGTIDSTADTTHFVDAALTGADDYILNSYFYNVTTGHGCLIADFTAIDDTVTLASADASMAIGDTYYILNAWLDLDQFTENARSAGDKVIIRRGANQCDDGTDLNFTSDGTTVAPIVIEADYDNLWHDQVDLSATATATLTFGSKVVTFSAVITGVLAAGDWIYVSGDDNREFAYEIKDFNNTSEANLYIPYKGNQAGSGRTVYNMQDIPVWNTAAGAFQLMFDTDFNWKVQGLDMRGTDTNGVVEIDSCSGIYFIDCIFRGNGSSDYGILVTDGSTYFIVQKSRFYNYVQGISETIGSCTGAKVLVQDCYFDGNTVSSNAGIRRSSGGICTVENCFFYRHVVATSLSSGTANDSGSATLRLRNCVDVDSHGLFIATSNAGGTGGTDVLVEDYGAVGKLMYSNDLVGTAEDISLFESDTATVRGGGSSKSIKVNPVTDMASTWPFTKVLLFEIPIYATTDSKTYTVYFNLPAANFTTAPTASELWIELEAWGHATNNYRKITKSTGTVTDDGNWQSLTVTVAPAQAGVAYLRCWYCKTKEAGSNIFYVDPLPVIS